MSQPETNDVEVLVPGLAPQQKQFGLTHGTVRVSSYWVQQQLQQQYGAGDLCHAFSEVALAPAEELQPGSYVYRVVSGAGG